ncbi:ATP-binding cassette domain-containing protein [Mycetocola reblochoni]|nr:excinuclease ABC subunit UvrA [Mycetocola reblochoni]RLP69673.1 excinuclease ABC subunit UvrA [Mycetocola reblochoni]
MTVTPPPGPAPTSTAAHSDAADATASAPARPSVDEGAHPADGHDTIRVRGARENNLRGVDVDLPKRRLTVFTGVSGSGKSSLVFGTIAAESRRMINETYSAFLQGFMPSSARPDVDSLDGLTTAIVVGQERMGANARSTLGTATDVNALLRILFSRLGSPHIGSPNAYSFNVATASGSGALTVERGSGPSTTERRSFHVTGGMCPECEGRGQISEFDLEQVLDSSLSLNEGAITVPGYKADGWAVRLYSESGLLDGDKPIRDYSEAERATLLTHPPTKVVIAKTNMSYEGLLSRLRGTFLSKDREAMQPHIRAFVDRAVRFAVCPSCAGTRLNQAARSSLVHGRSIAELCAMQLSELADWIRSVDEPEVAPLVSAIGEALDAFVDIGLGYLSLDRSAGTLSGGEVQRTMMVRHLASALTDTTYVFDEPTTGLHPHDIERMNRLLLQLRDKGNTVLVVEHKPETIAIADHVVDLGPGAGADGGRVGFAGSVDGLRRSDTLTGRHLDDRAAVKETVRSPNGAIEVRGAEQNNLDGVDVDIPLGVLTVVTGVAGSGKSTLIEGSVAPLEDVVVVDQSPIRGSRRSNPATYTGALEPIRRAFAKANGVSAALFSANSDGACPACTGAGVIYTDLGVVAEVASVCEECQGRRFQREVLEYRLGGLDISEVLALSVAGAERFFSTEGSSVPAAHRILSRLLDVGLGYLSLGQPLSTLSGGERQRIKLAGRLAEPSTVVVLDEPTTGLHLADVDQLLGLLDRLVDGGTTVIVVEHHQAVMAHADWIIDLGPGAGSEGGRVVFEGTPAQLVADRSTLTGRHLAAYVRAG